MKRIAVLGVALLLSVGSGSTWKPAPEPESTGVSECAPDQSIEPYKPISERVENAVDLDMYTAALRFFSLAEVNIVDRDETAHTIRTEWLVQTWDYCTYLTDHLYRFRVTIERGMLVIAVECQARGSHCDEEEYDVAIMDAARELLAYVTHFGPDAPAPRSLRRLTRRSAE